jgi:integrase
VFYLISRSPWPRRLAVPTRQESPGKVLTAQEIAQIVQSLPERYAALAVTQNTLGLRIGEACALRVSDVDFLRSTVTVGRTFDEGTCSFVDRTKATVALG